MKLERWLAYLFGKYSCKGRFYCWLVEQLCPHVPLLAPVEDGGNGPEHDLADGIAATLGAVEEEDGLLDVRDQ